MLSPMIVRCEQCGGENNPQYHFCGMCGTPLPRTGSQGPSPGPPPPASVPSFRTLGDQPRGRDLHYLLEDDDQEPRSRGGFLLATVLLLLAAAGGGATWYWHNGSWPWESRSTAPAASTPSSAPPSAENAATAPSPSGKPAPETTASPAIDKQEAATPSAPAPAPSPADNATNTDNSGSDQPAATETSNSTPGSATPEPSTAETPTEEPPPAPVKKAAAPHVSAVKTAKAKPAAGLANSEDSLVSEGEKYLYGNGVPQNCERAQKDILAAARQENAKAYTLLGAMYATGHCVSRDLPTAYRWFARALHQDPGNTRLQQNLEVIWRQMTPEERQVATHS